MSNAQTIFDRLRKAGMTEAGALGVMGNLQAESGLESYRLQGDFTAGFQRSHEYADRIDNGLLSVDAAAGDGHGWGLAQWTYRPRKKGCLEFCLSRSVSVGNLEAQVDFLLQEFRTEYADLFRYLCRTDNIYEACSRVCREFERPAVNNISDRFGFAQKLQNQLTIVPVAPPSEFWPPRMVCKGMAGADIGVLQTVLRARGYTLGDSLDVFGASTENALKKAQTDLGVDADGICGPKTWAAILERN